MYTAATQYKRQPALQDVKRMRPSSGSNSRKGKGKGGKPRASVTLKDLVDFGVILPGRNKISVSYKGINYLASLGKDGIIVYQGEAASPFITCSLGTVHLLCIFCLFIYTNCIKLWPCI